MATAWNPYAKFLGGREPLDILNETPSKLKAEVERLGPKGLAQSYAPGKWSLNTVICHLADCEVAFGFRWRQVVAQPHHLIQPFDQDAWAVNYKKQDATAALASFLALREWNLTWLHALDQESFSKAVTHPERGELTLHKLLQLTAGHDVNHLGQFALVR